MKKILLIALLLGAIQAKSQVFSGSQDIDKGKREGAYVISSLEEKFIDRVWKQYLTKLGRPVETKGTYTIKGGILPEVSAEPITFYSKIAKNRDRSLIFLSATLANGDIVTNGHEKWGALGKYITDFQDVLALHDAARAADKSYEDANENHKKVVKNGEKLSDRVEENKKEKEKLLKKIEENKTELEKLLTDIETNKKDQSKALDDIAAKKILADEARKKIQ
jgi:hypothetical protein